MRKESSEVYKILSKQEKLRSACFKELDQYRTIETMYRTTSNIFSINNLLIPFKTVSQTASCYTLTEPKTF